MSSSSSAACVSLHNVCFGYHRDRPVLDIEAMQIPCGRRIFLHGPSGSGKSTLLALIGGIVSAQQGEVQVLGHDLTRLSAGKRDRLRGSEIGYIFQGFNLIPYLSVEENIALPCEAHIDRRRRIPGGRLHDEVLRIAERLDMAGYLRVPVQELSTGQQQRVAIARAVMGAPPLVIADEPTSALDHDRRDTFLDLLTEIVAETGSTLLFVSHDMTLTSHFDEIISLPSINRSAVRAQR